MEQIKAKLQSIHESYWIHKNQKRFDSEAIALWRSEEYKQLSKKDTMEVVKLSQELSIKTLQMEESRKKNKGVNYDGESTYNH